MARRPKVAAKKKTRPPPVSFFLVLFRVNPTTIFFFLFLQTRPIALWNALRSGAGRRRYQFVCVCVCKSLMSYNSHHNLCLFNRLARSLSGMSFGLVLGGGGARGLELTLLGGVFLRSYDSHHHLFFFAFYRLARSLSGMSFGLVLKSCSEGEDPAAAGIRISFLFWGYLSYHTTHTTTAERRAEMFSFFLQARPVAIRNVLRSRAGRRRRAWARAPWRNPGDARRGNTN